MIARSPYLDILRAPVEFPHMVIPNTADAKLGLGWAGTYRPVEDSCPQCPLMRALAPGQKPRCYALRGRVNNNQIRSRTRRDSLLQILGAARVRHLISGDGFRRDAAHRSLVDLPYWDHVSALHAYDREMVGLCYSHGWRQLQRAGVHPSAMPGRLTLLASVDSITESRHAQAAGWNTARVTEDLNDRQPGEDVCPYDAAKGAGKKPAQLGISCSTCRRCWSGSNILFWKF